jgi:uncharacterized membrane protein
LKTQILQLETHDDFISVRDKLGWRQAGRILLVWPERGRILDRELDLLLLQRHSQALGSQLALVTQDPDVRDHAYQLDIPVFTDPRQAQRVIWRSHPRDRQRLSITLPTPRPRSCSRNNLETLRHQAHPTSPAWVTHPLIRTVIFILGILSVLALIAFLLPGAQVILNPNTRVQSITFDVQAGVDIPTLNLSGALPAHPITVVVEGRDSLPSSGTTQIPSTPARGEVVFKNLTGQSIEIPAGTMVITLDVPPMQFATKQAVVISTGTDATVSVPVEAVLPGSSGNQPPDNLVAVEGLLGLRLSVTNPEIIQGGTDQETAAPRVLDRNLLYDRLFTALQQSATEELKDKLVSGDFLLSPVPRLNQILEKKYIPEETTPAETLELTLRLEFQALVVSAQDLNRLALIVLDANLPKGYTADLGAEQSAGSQGVTYTNLTRPVWDATAAVARWQLQAERSIRVVVLDSQVTNLVMGLPPVEAVHKLETNLPLEGQPQIMLYPAWWPYLPYLPFRIMVKE